MDKQNEQDKKNCELIIVNLQFFILFILSIHVKLFSMFLWLGSSRMRSL